MHTRVHVVTINGTMAPLLACCLFSSCNAVPAHALVSVQSSDIDIQCM